MRVIFMGTADLACATLKALHQEESFSVVGVVSQPDKPKGRTQKLQRTPVKEVALASGLSVFQPERARNDGFVSTLRSLAPDLVVVAAYGQILPQTILDMPRFGCLNVHTSLLPRYRGAAPIQWAILNGDVETGVTIMKMDAGLDTGPIVSSVTTPIVTEDNAQTLHDRLANLGAELLVQTIPRYVSGELVPSPQPAEGVSYAPKISKEMGRIDWAQSADVLWNQVRGLTPWPGAYTPYTMPSVDAKPRVLKIWLAQPCEPAELGAGDDSSSASAVSSVVPGTILRADKDGVVVACGQKALRVLELQREGGRRLRAQEFLAGTKLPLGSRLGV